MLSPMKIIVVSSSLLCPKIQEPSYVLQGEYSVEAYEYMKKINPDKSNPLGDILYKTIYEEMTGRPVE